MTTLDARTTQPHVIDGGARASADGRTFEVRNPANGTLVAHVAEGGAAEVEGGSVAAPRGVFFDGRWPGLPVRERHRILNRFADLIEAALPQLSVLESTCTG